MADPDTVDEVGDMLFDRGIYVTMAVYPLVPRDEVGFRLQLTAANTDEQVDHRLWGLMLASVLFNTFETAGTIAWATAKQHHVRSQLLGRVSSLDWLISIGLLPLSYALTGPVSAALGARQTLIWAGVLGAIVTFAPLLSRRVRRFARSGEQLLQVGVQEHAARI